MAGIFRMKTPQSITRWEGEFARKDKLGVPRGQQRVTYLGDGQPGAPIGGMSIYLTDKELHRFGSKARLRFELVEGEWHDEPDIFDANAEDAPPPPDDIDKLLAHNVDDVVDALDDYEVNELETIRERELSEFGKRRKGVTDAIDAAIDVLE